MNERIQELAEQATTYIEPTLTSGEGWIFDKEKFAELIVQECVGVVEKRFMGDFNREDMEVRRCVVDLKQHFGVEEQVQDSKELHTCPYREEIHNDYESLCDCDEEQQHQCAMDI